MARGNPSALRLKPAALLVALSCAALAAGDSFAGNLVLNGDFELAHAENGDPSLWSATRVAEFADHVVFAGEDSVVHQGGHAVSIRILDSHPDTPVHYNWNQHVLAFEPGASYRASAWIRTENLTDSAFIVVNCWDRGMTEVLATVANQDVAEVVGTTDWTEVAITVDVPAETGRMAILLGIAAPANRGGKVWFDDVAFEPIVQE